jgi:hypothetical protein
MKAGNPASVDEIYKTDAYQRSLDVWRAMQHLMAVN